MRVSRRESSALAEKLSLLGGRARVALAALSLLAACGDDDEKKHDNTHEVVPAGDFSALAHCPFEVPAGAKVRCGTLSVPENYALTNGRKISISVAIFASSSAHPAADPLVYLAGGPGAGAISAMAMYYPALAPILAERELIAVDQRGTGFSEPALNCPELDAELNPEKLGADLMTCRKRLVAQGVDLAQYTTEHNAMDVRALRGALKAKSFSLLGTSYGTRLALELMRQEPESLRAVILDSTLPPDLDALAESASIVEHSFEQVFDTCAADATCAQAYPDLETRFYALMGQLDAKPLSTKLANGASLQVSGAVLLSILGQMLYDVRAIVAIPQIVVEAEAGKLSTLESLHVFDSAGESGLATGMNFSVVCAEYVPLTSEQKVKQADDGVQPELAAVFGPEKYLQGCPLWNVPAASENEAKPVHADTPTLILAGAYDPSTPASWGKHVAETLPHAHFSLFRGATHGVIMGPCGLQMVADFLHDPTQVKDPTCAEHDAPLAWPGH